MTSLDVKKLISFTMDAKKSSLEHILYLHENQQTKKNIFILNEIQDLSVDLCNYFLDVSKRIKYAKSIITSLQFARPVLGLFQQTSTRTRSSLDIAAHELRTTFTYMDWHTTNLHLTHPTEEIKILSELYSMIFVRMYDHALLVELSKASSVPFVNAMSTVQHPTQALTDFFTINECFKTDFSNLKLAFIGDANNVSRSLAFLAEKMNMTMVYSSPKSYKFKERVPAQYIEDPREAVSDADIIYTDTWVSIGDESEQSTREKMFKDYQVNSSLLSCAPENSLVMHCLPAHIGSEISEDVYTSPRSIHKVQAINKQYIMQSLMIYALHDIRIFTP